MTDPLTDLRRRSHTLSQVVATLTFDLGGLTAEMAAAGRFDHEVLTRHAAELRVAETELAGLQQLLATAAAGPVPTPGP